MQASFGGAGDRPSWPPGPAGGGPPTRGEPIFAPGQTRPPRGPVVRGHAGAAWVVIGIMVVLVIALPRLLAEPAQVRADQDALGLMLMRLQSQHIVGASELAPGGGEMAYQQSRPTLNVGTVAQRHRFIVVAAELSGPDEPARLLDELDELIANEQDGDPPYELSEDDAAVQAVLHILYPTMPDGETSDLADRVDALAPNQRALLEDKLGWFGRLALAPPGIGDGAAREAVLAPARRTAILFIGVFVVLGLGCAGGFIGLLVMLVLTLKGTVRSGLGECTAPHAIYAETFAVWMVAFFGLQIVAGIAALILASSGAPNTEMLCVSVAFLMSLATLAWPVLRGVPWATVRQDIGWTRGRDPVVEPMVGVAGYFMALPLLAVGVLMTFGLLWLQTLSSGPVPPLDPVGGPAHPVIMQLGGPSIWPKLMLLFVGAVAAPIVEETMFRGVLYRHLRAATSGFGLAGSVLAASTINAFVFAAIHPQGWVAIPALMSLAYAFTLLREWRGTVVPSMIVHGISNGLMLSMMMLMLGS